MRALALAVALTAVVAGVPAVAQASCIFPTPRDAIRQSKGAFVGRFIERQADGRLIYSVELRVKGEMGSTVVVRDEQPGLTSVGNLGAAPGEQYAIFMRRDAGGYIANGCSMMPVEAMRVAAASGREACERPQIRLLETRRAASGAALTVRIEIANTEGFPSGARIEWGDGESADADFVRSTDHVRVMTRRHVYPRAGRYRVRVVARSRPAAVDCFAGGRFAAPQSGSRARFVRVG